MSRTASQRPIESFLRRTSRGADLVEAARHRGGLTPLFLRSADNELKATDPDKEIAAIHDFSDRGTAGDDRRELEVSPAAEGKIEVAVDHHRPRIGAR